MEDDLDTKLPAEDDLNSFELWELLTAHQVEIPLGTVLNWHPDQKHIVESWLHSKELHEQGYDIPVEVRPGFLP